MVEVHKWLDEDYTRLALRQQYGKMLLTLLLHSVITCARVVDLNGLKVIVVLVAIGIHGVSNIRDVVTCIGLSSNVDLPAVEAESVNEGLPEAEHFLRSARLIRACGLALVESSACNTSVPHLKYMDR